MAASLTAFERAQGPLNPVTLKKLDTKTCAQIFGQDLMNGEAMELMEHFSNALAEFASFLSSYGSASELISACDSSAVNLAERLAEMSMFDDVGFYKRAQIAAADLARHQLANFNDLADLTAFADNLVPHVLVIDGVISLSADLADQISKGQLLEPGGRAETELRAAAVHVVELVTAASTLSSPFGLRAMDVDQTLWKQGGQPKYKQFRRPRCRSIYY